MAAKWTFFYYCNAESDLYDNVITMMKNMAAMKFPESPEVNILLLVDRIIVTNNMDTERFYTANKYAWHSAIRFVMKAGMDPVVDEGEDLGDLDMGMAGNLKNFLAWGTEHYPAEHYALEIYGHGSAVSVGNMMTYRTPKEIAKTMLRSYHAALNFIGKLHISDLEKNEEWFLIKSKIINDEKAPAEQKVINSFHEVPVDSTSNLYTPPAEIPEIEHYDYILKKYDATKGQGKNQDLFVFDIRKVLVELQQESGFRPDLILFDACFMCSFESILELHDVTDFILASQGFHSRALLGKPTYLQKILDEPGLDPKTLAQFITNNISDRLNVESIEAETVMCSRNKNPRVPDWFKKLFAYACIDTNKIASFNESFNSLIELMLQDDPITQKDIDKARALCLAYYITPAPDKFYMGIIDLLGFLRHLKRFAKNSALKEAARQTAELLQAAIIEQQSGEDMHMKDRPWYNPTGIGILFPTERNLDNLGATLIDAYWYNDRRQQYVFGNTSKWPEFLLKRINDWYDVPH